MLTPEERVMVIGWLREYPAGVDIAEACGFEDPGEYCVRLSESPSKVADRLEGVSA